ncbi:MAG: dienelactone hydrolase family protein [Acidobacteria bacterium]|nr:MAG: dienelactone hydrolase family protein [Acidobacteriota bacterium]
MEKKIVDLCSQYVRGDFDRRAFLDQLGRIGAGATATFGLLAALKTDARAQIVPQDDARLVAQKVEYDAQGVKISAYLARQKEDKKRPAILVIHENRGLNPHIQDVARRFALEGFLALAPDMLSPVGGTPADPAEAPRMIGSLKPEETVSRLAAGVAFLASHPSSTGKVGVVGFCWGGAMVNRLAAAGAGLQAAVSYYGSQLPPEEVPRISAPLLLHYAELDTRINAGIAGFEAALTENKKVYEKYMYEGANHAFNNDSNPQRYNKEAATLAWTRTIAFFKKYLV